LRNVFTFFTQHLRLSVTIIILPCVFLTFFKPYEVGNIFLKKQKLLRGLSQEYHVAVHKFTASHYLSDFRVYAEKLKNHVY